MEHISWADFEKIHMHVGTILTAVPFAKARKPAYQLTIDFGDMGILKSSAQITVHYAPEALIGRQIVAVINFPKKQIADFMSECLVLGAVGNDPSEIILLAPDMEVPNGLRIA